MRLAGGSVSVKELMASYYESLYTPATLAKAQNAIMSVLAAWQPGSGRAGIEERNGRETCYKADLYYHETALFREVKLALSREGLVEDRRAATRRVPDSGCLSWIVDRLSEQGAVEVVGRWRQRAGYVRLAVVYSPVDPAGPAPDDYHGDDLVRLTPEGQAVAAGCASLTAELNEATVIFCDLTPSDAPPMEMLGSTQSHMGILGLDSEPAFVDNEPMSNTCSIARAGAVDASYEDFVASIEADFAPALADAPPADAHTVSAEPNVSQIITDGQIGWLVPCWGCLGRGCRKCGHDGRIYADDAAMVDYLTRRYRIEIRDREADAALLAKMEAAQAKAGAS